MPRNNRVDIDVRVTGDARGADDVAKGLDKVAVSANKAGAQVGPGAGLSGRMAQMFPTFTRAGQAVGGFAANLTGMINPATLATAAIGVVVAKVVGAYNDMKAAEDNFRAFAGTGFDAVKTKIDSFLPSNDALVTGLQHTKTALDAITAGLAAAEAGIQQRIADENALAASTLALTQARLNLAVAEGRLSAEEAARQMAMTEAQSAEEAFLRQQEEAVLLLQQRQFAAAAVNAELEKLKQAEAAAVAAAATWEGQNTRERAANIDPKLNANIDNANVEMQMALEASKQDPIGASVERIKGGSALEMMSNLGSPLKAGYQIVTALAEEKEESARLEETALAAQKEANRATEARTAAVNAVAEQSRAEIESKRQAIEATKARKAQIDAEVRAAQANVTSLSPGGTGATVFGNNQAAAAINTSASATAAGLPPVSVADASGLAASPARDQFIAAIADGIQQSEIALLDSILAVLQNQNRGGGGAVAERLKRIETQLEQLRNGGS